MLLMKTDDVATILGMSPSTVKKYYLLVENHGYRFKRSQSGQVLFNEQDVQLFRKLIHMKNQKDMTLPKAVAEVMSSVTDIAVMSEFDTTDTTDTTVMTETNQRLEKLEEAFMKLLKQNEELLIEQRENRKLLENKSSEREELLTQSLRETMEVKKMILEERNKKWWQRFF